MKDKDPTSVQIAKAAPVGCAGLVVIGFVALVMGGRASNQDSPQPPGETRAFKGVAGSPEIATFSQLPYFSVTGPTMKVNCYYTRGGPPPKGAIVAVIGTATSWEEGTFGVLRPCAVL
jgi:hypothetical protein